MSSPSLRCSIQIYTFGIPTSIYMHNLWRDFCCCFSFISVPLHSNNNLFFSAPVYGGRSDDTLFLSHHAQLNIFPFLLSVLLPLNMEWYANFINMFPSKYTTIAHQQKCRPIAMRYKEVQGLTWTESPCMACKVRGPCKPLFAEVSL